MVSFFIYLPNLMQNRLKIALQKSGRLSEKSLALLAECGISINNGKNTLIAPASNFPAEVLYLRDDDIPQYVQDGVADIGIVGENVLLESGAEIRTAKKLGFSRCRLSLAIPKSDEYPGASYFEGKKIATSYPHLLQIYLDNQGVQAEIHTISGSVEIAPGIGLADGICDLVSTGSTLFSNGLKEVEIILRSEAVLVASPGLSGEKSAILEQLLFRIEAVRKAKANKYIVLNSPNHAIETVSAILPGMKSPTVVPLAREGWSALHSVMSEEKFWEVIDQLKLAGAEGILVMPIEKMIL